MSRPTVLRSKRIAACAMGIMVLLVVLFSTLFITLEADHDCTGEDCPVCACIAWCEHTLHQIGDGVSSRMVIVIPAILIALPVRLFSSFIAPETPVSRKVRLNN